MAQLKDRSAQIPNGFRFEMPEIKFTHPRFPSFDTLVNLVIEARRANPYYTRKNNWSTDRNMVAAEVDNYNTQICIAHGWNDYLVHSTGPAAPKSQAHSGFAARAAVGAKILREMFGAEGPIRDQALADNRALICADCPQNDKGDWTSFFTVPAQEFIRRSLSILKDLNMRTDIDSQLHVCQACGCPLKGKIWARIDHINKHMPEADKAKLDANCWILSESTK